MRFCVPVKTPGFTQRKTRLQPCTLNRSSGWWVVEHWNSDLQRLRLRSEGAQATILDEKSMDRADGNVFNFSPGTLRTATHVWILAKSLERLPAPYFLKLISPQSRPQKETLVTYQLRWNQFSSRRDHSCLQLIFWRKQKKAGTFTKIRFTSKSFVMIASLTRRGDYLINHSFELATRGRAILWVDNCQVTW